MNIEKMKTNKCTACNADIYFPERCGSAAIEIVLWVYATLPSVVVGAYFESHIYSVAVFISALLPALIYSLWRRTGRYKRCESCGSPHVVFVNEDRDNIY